MGFVKWRGNTKVKVAVEQFEALKSQFLFDIKATVELLEIYTARASIQLGPDGYKSHPSIILANGEERCKES